MLGRGALKRARDELTFAASLISVERFELAVSSILSTEIRLAVNGELAVSSILSTEIRLAVNG